MNQPLEQFWMVAGNGPCNYRHGSQDEAEREAKRLARLHPDCWFFVVETISAHRKSDVHSVSLRPGDVPRDDIPF